MTQKDKRPDSSRLISSFDEPLTDGGGDLGEHTIPGAYSTLSEGHAEDTFEGGLSDLIDPSLDQEFADRTQTDIMIPPPDMGGHEAQKQMEALVEDCLAALDDIDNMIRTARKLQVDAKLIVDMEMSRKRFLNKLGNYEVEHQPAAGVALDPALHEVVREVSVDDAQQDGVIVEVEREGYAQHGQPLRRARVVVGKKS